MELFNASVFSRYEMEYGDIRILKSEIQQSVVQNGGVHYLLTGSETGAGVRILKDGNWGFSSTTDIGPAGLTTVVQRAYRACTPSRGHVQLANVSPVRWVSKDSLPSRTVSDLIEMAKDLESAMHCSSCIREGRVGIRCHSSREYFFNTDGCCIEQNHVLLVFDFHATAIRNGKISQSHLSHVLNGEELLEEDTLTKRAVDTATEAVQELDAGAAPNGQFSVILGPSLASVFIHEAVGHRMEADEVMRPHAIMKNKTGKLITDPSLSVIDTMNEVQKWYEFDDEGVSKTETVLIDKGEVQGFLHDRQTAHCFGAAPTGNSRASSYDTKPLIRMTNIRALEGEMSYEEMVEECSNGLFLDGFVGGAALADGTFRFVARRGHLIKRGDMFSPIGRSAISGSTLDALSSLSGVGTAVSMHYSECIKKGQGITVGLGSPALLVSQLRVGGVG